MSGILLHQNTAKMNRTDLQLIQTPTGTNTHHPVSHYEVVTTLLEALRFRHLDVTRDEYAVSADGMRMFGVLDLQAEFEGTSFSIGIRNANDKSMRLAFTAGYRVLVCDNMAFMGEYAPVARKHTNRLDLRDVISIGVDKIQRNFEPMQQQISRWRELGVQDEWAKLLIYRAFVERGAVAPLKLMQSVHEHYFNPSEVAFEPRTMWSLSNAFTSAFKQLKPIPQFQATGRLGPFLEAVQPAAASGGGIIDV